MTKYAISITSIVDVDNYEEAHNFGEHLVDYLELHYATEDTHYWNVEELAEDE